MTEILHVGLEFFKTKLKLFPAERKFSNPDRLEIFETGTEFSITLQKF
jgi:hypothetical protein